MNWLVFYLLLTVLQCSWGFWDYWESTKDTILGERCIDRWLPRDFEGLEDDLRLKVFGQPFLEQALLPVLKRHIGNHKHPKKALVLSFHGSAGVGKTYVLEIIAKHLFKAGHRSKYYKFIQLSDSYSLTKASLSKLVIDTVTICPRAMFVFDEIEKMPEGFFNALKPFIDFHPEIDGVDYRKAVFVFISNIGMSIINELSLSQWNQGINRENFDLAMFEKALFKPAYNEKGGLKETTVVRNHLIDMYLPFLPLERSHVEKCIDAESKSMGYSVTSSAKQIILNSLEFLPAIEQLYSSSGCKNLQSLIFRHGKQLHSEL